VEIVDYLLSKGARIDDRGGDKCGGITPLHDACSCGNLPVVELLVEKGANLHARDDQVRRRVSAELIKPENCLINHIANWLHWIL